MAPRRTVEDEKAEVLKRLTLEPIRVDWAHVVPSWEHYVYDGSITNDAVLVCSNCGGHCIGERISRMRMYSVMGPKRVAYEKRGRLFMRSVANPRRYPRHHRMVSGWRGPNGRIICVLDKTCWRCHARLDWRTFVRRLQTYSALVKRHSAASSTKPE